MKIEFKYGNKCILISPYNTKTEKELLLLGTMSEDNTIDDALDILSDNIHSDITELNRYEKIILLLKLREISVGDDKLVKYKCTCGKVNESVMEITYPEIKEQISIYNDIVFKNMIGKYTSAEDYTDEDLDELDIDEFNKIDEFVKSQFIEISTIGKCRCLFCGEEKLYDIDNDKYLIDNMSETSLLNIYTIISDMTFYSHYTMADVENMIPFERTVLYDLLINIKKEHNK